MKTSLILTKLSKEGQCRRRITRAVTERQETLKDINREELSIAKKSIPNSRKDTKLLKEKGPITQVNVKETKVNVNKKEKDSFNNIEDCPRTFRDVIYVNELTITLIRRLVSFRKIKFTLCLILTEISSSINTFYNIVIFCILIKKNSEVLPGSNLTHTLQ